MDPSLLQVTVTGVCLFKGFYLLGSLDLSLYCVNRLQMARSHNRLYNWLGAPGAPPPPASSKTGARTPNGSGLVTLSAGELVPRDGELIIGQALVDRRAPWLGAVALAEETGDRVYAQDLILAGQLFIQPDLATVDSTENGAAENGAETIHAKIANRLIQAAQETVLPSLFETNASPIVGALLASGALTAWALGAGPALAVLSAGLGFDGPETRAAYQAALLHRAAQQGVLLLDLRALATLEQVRSAILDFDAARPGRLSTAVHQLRVHGVEDIYLLTDSRRQAGIHLAQRLGVSSLPGHSSAFSRDLIQHLQSGGQRVAYISDRPRRPSVPELADLVVIVGSCGATAVDNAHVLIPGGEMGKLEIVYGAAAELQAGAQKNKLLTTLPGLATLAGVYALGMGFGPALLLNHGGTLAASGWAAPRLQPNLDRTYPD